MVFGTHLLTLLPTYPQVSTSQETCNRMPRQVMDPSLPSQLCHDGVDEREPCACLNSQTSIFNKSVVYYIQ